MAKKRIVWFLLLCSFFPVSFRSSHAAVTIKVSDISGSPVANAVVALTRESDTSIVYTSSTDDNGLCNIDFTDTGVAEKEPQSFALGQNYPNPFNPSTVIPFSLSRDGEVKLVIYNALGQNVRTLADGRMSAGAHTVVWDGTDDNGSGIASGIYIYVLSIGKERHSKKMLLLDGHNGEFPERSISRNAVLLKPSAETFTIKITGLDIETFEQTGNSLSDGNSYEFVVTRREDSTDIIFTGAGVTGTPVSDVQRMATFGEITQTLNAFNDIPDTLRCEQLAHFLAEQPEIEIAGYGTGGVWARFTDGRLIIFDTVAETDKTAKSSVSPARKSANESAPAEAPRTAVPSAGPWSDIPRSNHICLYSGVDEPVGWLSNIEIFTQDPTDESGKRIYSYTIDGGIREASVDALMNIPSNCAVFALDSHGSTKAWNRSLERSYAIYTTTQLSITNELKYWDMLQAGELVYYHPMFENWKGVITFTDSYYHYAFTAEFVKKYWAQSKRFEAEKTFVYFNVCSGMSANAGPMISAIISAGASLYAGWTYRSFGQVGPETASYIFDRLLGSNMWHKTSSDPHRPYSWDTLNSEMISLGYGKAYDDVYGKNENGTDKPGDAKYSWLKFRPAPGCPFKQLAPGIRYMEVDEKVDSDEPAELTIYGTFGTPQDEVFIKKENARSPSPLTIKTWEKDKIICYLEDGDYGDVSVKVNGNRSNLRPLSRWEGKVRFTVIPKPVVAGQISCTLKDEVTWDLKMRADVAPRRGNKPEEKATYQAVGFLPTKESTTTFSSSGSQVIKPEGEEKAITVYSWTGNGKLRVNDPRDESISHIIYSLDKNTRIAKMDILFQGVIGSKTINSYTITTPQQINTAQTFMLGLYNEVSKPKYWIHCPLSDNWEIENDKRQITIQQYQGVAGVANAPVKIDWDSMPVSNPPLDDQYHGK